MYQPKPKDDKSVVFLNPDGSSDDSKGKPNSEEKKVHEKEPYQITDKDVQWETNNEDDDDSEW